MKKMKELSHFSNILKSIGLFRDIEATELGSMLTCLSARTQNLKKGKTILFAGDRPEFTGIVLSGLLHIIREDYDGNRSIIASIAPGEMFAEALCCAGVSESPVTVVAAEDSIIMKLGIAQILKTCSNACPYHEKLIANLLAIIAGKNLFLQGRMEILSLKSVRAKVILYLESFGLKQGRKIEIPFNREEMADYLCVERSALSHELIKMKRDGLIDYWKNQFILKLPISTRQQD